MYRNHKKNWKDMLSVDFSTEYHKKEEIKQVLLQQVKHQETIMYSTQKEDFIMNQTNKRRLKRSSVIAFAACLTLVFSITAFAVVNYLELGPYIKYRVESPSDSDKAAQAALNEKALPDLVYDENGKLLEKFGEIEGKIYNADGEAIMVRGDDAGNLGIITLKEEEKQRAQATTLFNDREEMRSYLSFNARPFTSYPADYELEGYRIYNDEDGQPSQDSKYLEMNFYKNGDVNDWIYIQARYMDETTSFVSGATGSTPEKTSINGYEAIIDGNHIDILIDNVMYMISAKNLPRAEVVKMAESLTK